MPLAAFEVHRARYEVHWIRYTTLTWVERNFSYAVAAPIEELAVAVAVLTRGAAPAGRVAARMSMPLAVAVIGGHRFPVNLPAPGIHLSGLLTGD